MKKNTGFTLIEVMIVVAIIGILAAIAYPSYTDSVRKSRRTEGTGKILELANRMERCFTTQGTYTGCAAIGTEPTENGYYSVVTAAPTAATYTITATPAGAQAGDAGDCPSMSITETGAKTPLIDTNRCWGK